MPTAPSRKRVPGRPFPPGVSGNPGGRPKGSHTFAVRNFYGEALVADPTVRPRVVAALRDAVTSRRTVVQALESAARINREIGMGADDVPAGVTINVFTNVRVGRLKR